MDSLVKRDTALAQADILAFERAAWERGCCRVAGVDEAGRGSLAGSVVAAAVVLNEDSCLLDLADSKLLPASTRQRLAEELKQALPSGAWAVVAVEAAEVDRLNILRATHLAMRQALSALRPTPDFALVDGLPVPGLLTASRAIVKGDRQSASIAAASILAKVHRDHLMQLCDQQFPGYDFATHKGYGTVGHLEALRRLGPCPLHRRSFAPVAQCLATTAHYQLELTLTDNLNDS